MAFILCALIPAPAFAQVQEEVRPYDDSTDALTINILPQDIIAWREEGTGIDSGIRLYLSDDVGKELYDITSMNVGEQLYVQVRGYDAYDFLIEDPMDDYTLFMNLGNSEIKALTEYLPFNPGQIPKTRVRR
jgi:hypothetical protein